MKNGEVFPEKVDTIEFVEEPFQDLKKKQLNLMDRWAENPNHVIHLRKAAQK